MMKRVPEKSLDSELWHACAGGMIHLPPVNSKVFYFPQGHGEHTLGNIDFGALPRIPPLILCRVSSVKYLADPETDEVYARIKMIPVGNNQIDIDEDGILGSEKTDSNDKPTSFSKALTQSDANNGGGFSVPRYCAETIFPRLDYTADPPVQNVIARDVHGETWKFRHIYRGTPRRHLLTTGWSSFVNQKKLVAGDSIVFLRAESGDLCVGIRRAKRGGGSEIESSTVWNSGSTGNYGNENKVMHKSSANGNLEEEGRERPESVVESVFLAASGLPFEVVYYPRASTPEFFVKASAVKAAMSIRWFSGMRFKMAFETEDSSRISWFMGTISSVQVLDPGTWPNSPWRLLKVSWDEPELLQNVKCVSPWLVELVSSTPVLHISPFSPPRKKLRPPSNVREFPFNVQYPPPSFLGNPLGPSSSFCHQTDNVTVGIQGARHAQIRAPSTNPNHNRVHMGFSPVRSSELNYQSEIHDGRSYSDSKNNIFCLSSMGNPCQRWKKGASLRTPQFTLFGQPILTEQQMIIEPSQDTILESFPLDRQNLTKSLSDGKYSGRPNNHRAELGLNNGHCKVFLESEEFGRTLNLSVLGSYEELFKSLEHMFGIERSEVLSHVFYHDATGAVRQAGDERFSEFIKTARRLTILTKLRGNFGQRKLITGLPPVEHGLDSSNQTGPLSLFA